jgi:hypothetical protein
MVFAQTYADYAREVHDTRQPRLEAGQRGSVAQVNREQQFVEDHCGSDSAASPYTGDFSVPCDASSSWARSGCRIFRQDGFAINFAVFRNPPDDRAGGDSNCGVATT